MGEWARGECKTPGGKMVAVRVRRDDDGRVAGVEVGGDFFIEPADGSVEQSVKQVGFGGTTANAWGDGCVGGQRGLFVEHPVKHLGNRDGDEGLPTDGKAGRARMTAGAAADGDDPVRPGTDGDEPARSDDVEAAAGALLADLGQALAAGEPAAAAIARHPEVRVVGVDAAAIDAAYARALAGFPRNDGSVGVSEEAQGAGFARIVRAMQRGRAVAAGFEADVPPGLAAECDRRWARLAGELVVVRDKPRAPAGQMTLDGRWAREVAAGVRPPTLRFWEWASPCVVIGRFQSLSDEVHEDVARAEGFAVVRRVTGGGAMVVVPAGVITYSLYAPAWFVDGLDARAAYRLCDRPIVRALADLGVAIGFSGLNDIASPRGKIGGAAQRRYPASPSREASPAPSPSSPLPAEPGRQGGGAVLHHTTLAYDLDADLMARLLNTSPEKLADKAVRSARRRVDPLNRQTDLTREQVVDWLAAHIPAAAAASAPDGGPDREPGPSPGAGVGI